MTKNSLIPSINSDITLSKYMEQIKEFPMLEADEEFSLARDLKNNENIFKMIYCLFVIFGSSLSIGAVIDLSDSMMFLMALFNIVGVYLLASKVKQELSKYLKIKFSE